MVDDMFADDKAMEGARSSAAKVLTQFIMMAS